MSASATKKGHVNFGSEDIIKRDNEIVINENCPGHIQVNLGFLQYQHIYSISVEFPKCYFFDYDLETILIAADKSMPNAYCKILSIKEKENFYEMAAELHASKERLLKEEVQFNFGNDFQVKVEFHARVLGKGKGTPLLKNGIKCIGSAQDDLSEASDWQAD